MYGNTVISRHEGTDGHAGAGLRGMVMAGSSNAMPRQGRSVLLFRLAALLLAIFVLPVSSTIEPFTFLEIEAAAAESKVTDPVGDHEECSARLKIFISELDALLEADPRSLEPLLSLLQKHFPIKNCDIKEAIAISGKSKYFVSASEQPASYVIAFSSARRSSGPPSGFNVIFGLSKTTGDTQLRFAQVNKAYRPE